MGGHFRRTFLGCWGKTAFPIWEKLPSWPRRWLDSPLHLVPVSLPAELCFSGQRFSLESPALLSRRYRALDSSLGLRQRGQTTASIPAPFHQHFWFSDCSVKTQKNQEKKKQRLKLMLFFRLHPQRPTPPRLPLHGLQTSAELPALPLRLNNAIYFGALVEPPR